MITATDRQTEYPAALLCVAWVVLGLLPPSGRHSREEAWLITCIRSQSRLRRR